jgi:hypothetical protein
MSPLSLSELVIVKREDFNRQFVDGAGIIHIFLFLKSQQNADQLIYCDFIFCGKVNLPPQQEPDRE